MFGDEYEAEEINKVWGVDVYAMSRADFYRFCMSFAKSEIVYENTGSLDYPYRFFDKALTREQQIEVLTTAVSTLAPKVIGKRTYSTRNMFGQESVDRGSIVDPNLIDWDTAYLFERSMSYLSGYSLPSVANVFIDLVIDMYDKDRYRKDIDADERRDFYEYYICDCYRRNLQKALVMERGQVLGVSNAEILGLYAKQLPLLKALSKKNASKFVE